MVCQVRRCSLQDRASERRHLAHDAARIAGFFIGIVNAADIGFFSVGQQETSPERLFCHCYGRGEGNAQLIPGWPYSLVVALEPGRTSWTLPLDAVRLGPADDATEVTAAQVGDVVTRLTGAGQWRDGDRVRRPRRAPGRRDSGRWLRAIGTVRQICLQRGELGTAVDRTASVLQADQGVVARYADQPANPSVGVAVVEYEHRAAPGRRGCGLLDQCVEQRHHDGRQPVGLGGQFP
jgi:hypothetical protein